MPLFTVQYFGYVEASRQGYSMFSLDPIITIHYIGYEEAFRQGYSTANWGHYIRSIILAMRRHLDKAIVR
jgi:hypothetical protein